MSDLKMLYRQCAEHMMRNPPTSKNHWFGGMDERDEDGGMTRIEVIVTRFSAEQLAEKRGGADERA